MSWEGQSAFSQQEKSLDQDRLIVFHNHAVIFCASQKVGGPRVQHSCAVFLYSRPARITRLFVSLSSTFCSWMINVFQVTTSCCRCSDRCTYKSTVSWYSFTFLFFVSQEHSTVKSCRPDWFYRQTKIAGSTLTRMKKIWKQTNLRKCFIKIWY